MTQYPPDNEPEMIFTLAVEGGGCHAFRRHVEEERWEFWWESTGMSLNENDDEEWVSHTSESVTSFDALIESLWKDWIMFVLTEIHPEYRDVMRLALRQRLPQLNEHHYDTWKRYMEARWRKTLHIGAEEGI